MINPFLFLFTELSSSSDLRDALLPSSLEQAAFYRDEQGYLIPLLAGSFHYVISDDEFIVGIGMHDRVYAIYDIDRRQIVVRIGNMQNVVMDEELHQNYDHVFVRLSPPSPPRGAPSAPNHRRRHNQHIINKH